MQKDKSIDQIKIPEQIIQSCSDCPYCIYDSYYDGPRNSGYECKKANERRIIADWNLSNENNKNRLTKSKDYKGIPIPDWCPFRETKFTREEKQWIRSSVKNHDNNVIRILEENASKIDFIRTVHRKLDEWLNDD
jgi:hypothetical protein